MAGCSEHTDVAAVFRCDGCERLLCEACSTESHALVLCRHCGEMAMPIDGAGPVSVKQLKKQRKVSKSYSLKQAMFYPIRGNGLFMYIATLITFAFLWFISFSIIGGCFVVALHVGFWLMVLALQFKIVRTTADGEDELPSWPDYTDAGIMFRDFLTWIVIQLLQFGPLVIFVLPLFSQASIGGVTDLLATPSYPFWLAFTVCWWGGSALSMMGFGAAGAIGRSKSLAVHHHIQGFFCAGVDAIKITNIIFFFGIVVWLVKVLLGAVPLVGAMASGILGTYWLFTVPHLAGVLFRRHGRELERYYGD